MDSFFLQNELTPKRLAFLARRSAGQRPARPRPAPEPTPEPQDEAPQEPEEGGGEPLTHLTESIRERISELNAEELLSAEGENESPQEIVNRLKELSKAPDAKIYEWYGARYSDYLGTTVDPLYVKKNNIRSEEIKRFKTLIGKNGAKELEAIIAASPKPEKYGEALAHLKTGIDTNDTFGTKELFKKLEKDAKKVAGNTADIGYESVKYVELMRKKIELDQKLKDEQAKIAQIDEEIKAHKESEATIEESKEQYIDWKRKWLMRGLKGVGYLSIAGGWLGAMSGLTGVGVSALSTFTGVSDIGFLKGLGIGATWLFQAVYHGMKKIEDVTEVGLLPQLGIAALSLLPIDFGIKKFKTFSSRIEYNKKLKELEKKKEPVSNRGFIKRLYTRIFGKAEETEAKKIQNQLSDIDTGLAKYKKLNLERVKLFQGQKKHYEIIQDDLIRQIDAKRKKMEPLEDTQEKLDTVTKTILSLESFLSLFSVSEGDRAERIIALPILDPEKIVENIQAMEDKLEPQLSQNLLSLATREQTRLAQEQTEAKNIVKRNTLKDELKVLKSSEPSVRSFFKNISRKHSFSDDERIQVNDRVIDLEQNYPKTARLIKILLELPQKTRFRKEIADTVLNIMDMKDQEEGGVGGRPEAGGPGVGGPDDGAPGAGGPGAGGPDAGGAGAGGAGAGGPDAGGAGAGGAGAGGPGAGGPGAGGPDAGGPDAGGLDAGGPDAGGPDVGGPDVGGPDVGGPDDGGPDAGRPDAGAPGAGAPGAGAPGAGGPGAGAPPEADRPQPIDYAPEGIGGFSAEELEFAYPNIFGYGYPLNSPAMADERLLLSDPQSNTSKMLRILLEEGLDEANNRIVLLAKQLHQKYKRVVTSHNLPSSQFGEHITWAAWDICKQLLYHRGLSQPDRRYIIGDPFRSKELQQQIIDRHLGWEMHQHYHETGRLQLPADHPNRELIRNVFRYQEPRYEGDWQIPSLAYSKVGELIRTGFVEVPDDEDDRSAEPPEPPKPDDKESNENLENTKKLIEDLKKTIDELQGSIRNLEDIPPTDDVVGRGIRAEIAEQKRALLGYQKNLSNLQTLINTNS